MKSFISLHTNGCEKYTNILNRHCTYNVSLSGVRVTILAVEKVVSVTYYECVFIALVIQHAKLMRRTVLPSVACIF